MKDEHKNMLLGYLAAKSQNKSQNNDEEHWVGINWFQQIWLTIFAWGIPLLSIICLTFYFIDSDAAISILGMSFEGSRQTWAALILGAFSIYVLFKAIRKFPRLFFWSTFLPPFIIFLIWFFDI